LLDSLLQEKVGGKGDLSPPPLSTTL